MLLPLTLKIIIGILILQIILLFILGNRRTRIILLTMIPVLAIGVWQGLEEYDRKNKDLNKTKADVKISATDLIKEYETSDSIANGKYLGKIIELTGNVKKVENDGEANYTIILGEQNSLSSVRCTMDTTYSKDAASLNEGSSVTIRGLCTGFKKNELLGENLGSDVELNRSVVVKNKK